MSPMSILLSLVVYCVLASTANGRVAAPPNIIFILTDDLGMNYPGSITAFTPSFLSPYNNGENIIKTPTLDRLALEEGVRLESSYMYKFCAPSRGSFLTGRYPWKLSCTRCNFIPSTIPEGIDLGYTMLPKHLAKAGYYSSHIGKWHQGFFQNEYTPVARGFNESFGFLEGGQDHWTHRSQASQTNCSLLENTTAYFDLWTQNNTNYPGGPLYGLNGTQGDEDTYSGFIYTEKAVETIHNHAKTNSNPLFMYLALQNTHAPVQAPKRFIDMYNTGDPLKDGFSAMMSVVDESVQRVTNALRSHGLWENTVVIWTTDNGSPIDVAGSNHPFKGGKKTNWEGGVRVPTFVTGGYLPPHMKGQSLTGLFHVADWYATFSRLAGLGSDVPADGPSGPDSYDMWDYISGQIQTSPRTEIIHDHRMFNNASRVDGCRGQAIYEKPGYNALGAIRLGDYKLIIGDEYEAFWFGEFSPNNTGVRPKLGRVECVDFPCLYDIVNDPGEHVNLATRMPFKVHKLWDRFNQSDASYHPQIVPPKRDNEGFCQSLLKHNYWVAPWR